MPCLHSELSSSSHCMQNASWCLCSDAEGLTWAHLPLPDLASFFPLPHCAVLGTRGHVSFLGAFPSLGPVPPSRMVGPEICTQLISPPAAGLSSNASFSAAGFKMESPLLTHLSCCVSFFHSTSLGVLENLFIHYCLPAPRRKLHEEKSSCLFSDDGESVCRASSLKKGM